MLVIVPNQLRDTIYQKIDEQIKLTPDALPERENLYYQLLDYYDENGTIPDFSLIKKDITNVPQM